MIAAALSALALLAAPSAADPPPAGWHRIFTDDFSQPGPFPTAGWTAYPPSYSDTSGHGNYDCSSACVVAGGQLRLHLHGGVVAAPAPKLPALTEARYSVRFRVPAQTPGVYKIAWLLWPDAKQGGATAKDGELDFPEAETLAGPIAAHTHWKSPSGNGDQQSFDAGADTTSWHTAVLERRQGSVRYLLDGRLVGESTGARLPTVPMHWVLQSETRLEATATPAAESFADIEVDWATVDAAGGPLAAEPSPPAPASPPSPPAPPQTPVAPAPAPPPPPPASGALGAVCAG